MKRVQGITGILKPRVLFGMENADNFCIKSQGWTPRPAGQRGCPAPPRAEKNDCCPAPPRKIPLLPSPAPPRPWKWSNCGAFAGQNENSKTLKRPKIFTNAYGQAGHKKPVLVFDYFP